MLHYFYMLSGDEDTCKPDRMICRFLKENVDTTKWNDNSLTQDKIEDIQELFRCAVKELKRKGFGDMTVRLLDNQLWKYQKSRGQKR